MVDQRGERGGRRAWQAIIGEGRPLGQVRHDIRGEEFTGLFVIPIAIDQQVDAGVLVLSDQIDGLGHRTEKAGDGPRAVSCARFAAAAASLRARSQPRTWVFSIVS